MMGRPELSMRRRAVTARRRVAWARRRAASMTCWVLSARIGHRLRAGGCVVVIEGALGYSVTSRNTRGQRLNLRSLGEFHVFETGDQVWPAAEPSSAGSAKRMTWVRMSVKSPGS